MSSGMTSSRLPGSFSTALARIAAGWSLAAVWQTRQDWLNSRI
jgi:hypothetical protein